MQNFQFKNSVKIVFVKNQSEELSNLIGGLVIYGGDSIKINNIYD